MEEKCCWAGVDDKRNVVMVVKLWEVGGQMIAGAYRMQIPEKDY